MPSACLPSLELVGDRSDDRDPEPALGETVIHRPVSGGVEPRAVVRNLDDDPVGLELVHDLDDAFASRRSPWRTELVHASVTASFMSATVSSPSRRSRESPLSASRARVMYSAFAGIDQS